MFNCEDAGKKQRRYSQEAVHKGFTYRKDTVEIQERYSRDTGMIQKQYRKDTETIQERYSKHRGQKRNTRIRFIKIR